MILALFWLGMTFSVKLTPVSMALDGAVSGVFIFVESGGGGGAADGGGATAPRNPVSDSSSLVHSSSAIDDLARRGVDSTDGPRLRGN